MRIKINDNWKMAYILYKIEGISYEIEKNKKGHVVFLIDDAKDVQNAMKEWEMIKINSSEELVNIGKYIFYKNLVAKTIKSYKGEKVGV